MFKFKNKLSNLHSNRIKELNSKLETFVIIKLLSGTTFEEMGLNYRQIGLLLASISIILWSVSILFSKLEIGSYGLISGINPLFFVSTGILIISFFNAIKKNIDDNFMLVLHLALIILFFSSIPVLIEGTPRFPYNYQTAQSVDFILQYGHSNSNIMHYQSWPGVFYFGAIETLITNISPVGSLLVIPLMFVIINLLVYYLLYSTFLNKKETWMALLLSNVLFYSSPVYLLPGVIGIMMITFALLLFFRFDLLEKRSSGGMRLIFIIFCGAAVISHFLNSVYLFMTLTFITVLSFLLKEKIFIFSKIKHKFSSIQFKGDIDKKFIMVFVFIAIWQVFLAGSYAFDTLTDSVHATLNLEKTVDDVKGMAYSGSQSHSNVVNVRIVSTLLLIILAGIGFFYEFLYRRRLTFKDLSLFVWMCANVSVTAITSYNGEIVNRTMAVSYNILYMLTSKLTDSRKLSFVLLFILIIAPPLSIVNSYGNEAIDYVSPAEISGVTFIIDHSVNSSAIESLGYRVWPLRYSNNLTWVRFDLKNFERINRKSYFKLYNNIFILNGERDKEDYNFQSTYANFNKLNNLEINNDYNKVFESNGFELYYMEGRK